MKKKKEMRGRKPKVHKPLGVSFNEALGVLAKSKYKNEKTLKAKKK